MGTRYLPCGVYSCSLVLCLPRNAKYQRDWEEANSATFEHEQASGPSFERGHSHGATSSLRPTSARRGTNLLRSTTDPSGSGRPCPMTRAATRPRSPARRARSTRPRSASPMRPVSTSPPRSPTRWALPDHYLRRAGAGDRRATPPGATRPSPTPTPTGGPQPSQTRPVRHHARLPRRRPHLDQRSSGQSVRALLRRRGRPVHETDPLGHRTAAPPILVHTRDARVSRLTPRDDTLSRLLEAPDRFV